MIESLISQSSTWLAGGGLAALGSGSIILLLFTDSAVLAGIMGVIAVTFILTGLIAGRGKTGDGHGQA